MNQQKLPTARELDESLTFVLRGARSSQTLPFQETHGQVVQLAATNGLKALTLLPKIKAALGSRASKTTKDAVLHEIAALSGETHTPEPEDNQK